MSNTAFVDEAKTADARGRCYGLLASVYNSLPNAEFAAMMTCAEVRAVLDPAVRDAPASDEQRKQLELGLQTLQDFWSTVADVPQEELLLRLGVDRTRLFRGLKRGHGPPPPYESLYRGGPSVMAEPALAVRKVYADAGYGLPAGSNELPDYVGLELDFMRFLCEAEARAWKEQGQGRALEHLTNGREFLSKHVVEWVPAFCDEVLTHAREDFYRGMAQITRAFVILDAGEPGSPDARRH
jgi:TorA maturation chaperone TorD